MKKTEKTENIEEIEEVKVKKAKKKEEKENIAQEETKEQDKVKEIIEKAKSKGQITYGELASQLDEANSEQIDKVFDAFEEIGVDILQEDLEEPDIEDLEEVEDIKLEEIDLNAAMESVNIDEPVRMYLREIGRIPLLSFETLL